MMDTCEWCGESCPAWSAQCEKCAGGSLPQPKIVGTIRLEEPFPEGTRFRVHIDNGYPEGEWKVLTLRWVDLQGPFGLVPVFYDGVTSGADVGLTVSPDRFMLIELE